MGFKNEHDDFSVEIRGDGCGGYLVVINKSDSTHTWGFADIDNIKLWHKILGEVVKKWPS